MFFPVPHSEHRHAAHCNHRRGRRLGDDGESDGFGQPRDEVRVDHGSRGGVVFANRAAVVVRHEEVVARQRESVGAVQPRDEVGVNRGSRGGVVFANRAAAEVRHEEVVARQRESDGARSAP